MKIPFSKVLTPVNIITGIVVLTVAFIGFSRMDPGSEPAKTPEPSPSASMTVQPSVSKKPGPKPSVSKTPLPTQLTASNIIELINDGRYQRGIKALKPDSSLRAAAQAHANDMAAKGYFSHNSPEGGTLQTRLAAVGYQFSTAGENLATGGIATAVYNNWSNSPEHLANMVNPEFTEIGVGIAGGTYQGRATTFVVAVFGSR